MQIIEFDTSFYIIQVDCKIKRIASPCSKTCTDHGSPPTKVITSRIVQQPSFGGRPCPRVSRIERQCFAPPCPPPGKFSSDNTDSFQKDNGHVILIFLIADWNWFNTLQIVEIKQTASHAAVADTTYLQNALRKSWVVLRLPFLSIRHIKSFQSLKAKIVINLQRILTNASWNATTTDNMIMIIINAKTVNLAQLLVQVIEKKQVKEIAIYSNCVILMILIQNKFSLRDKKLYLECVRAQSLEICEKCQHTNQCKAPYKCCPITKLCVMDCNTKCEGAAKAICHPPCTDQENPKSCQCLSSDFPLNWGGPTCRSYAFA